MDTPTARVPVKGAGTRTTQRSPGAEGFQLYEMLVALAILGLLATTGIPRIMEWTRQLKVEMAARELVGVLREARSYAVRHNSRVGVKFRPGRGSRVTYTLYRDGDGDGVRTSDIEEGADPAVSLPRELSHFGRQVSFGFPPGPAPRDPGDPRRRLDRLEDPVRFNRSDIASFNPLGRSTPGSLYLTDGRYLLCVVRLYGRTGKITIKHYDPRSETWQ
jgi:prepilin-type N-terminal cleavage/methylation domain-containing protein